MQQVSTTDERERVQRIAQSFLALDLTSERLGEIRYMSQILFLFKDFLIIFSHQHV